ncbi:MULTISPECIES: DUF6541 family protein [Actinomyces]|uniref:Beta-carotene 15,15'-monooxygenase n=1 Tax=Actinomyces respiraculi TaxID=2744574 RepID=A0A7T0LMI6_9ACTO|nr:MULTISPECIES: DUF6541 family protein [Actinomyces]QPL06499.1 beta-carotene 15,15'-monooxygenase [Actinomyces respiraculi]
MTVAVVFGAFAWGLLLLLAPGWLIARAGGLRGVAAASVATGLSCAVIGVAELGVSAAGLPWGRVGWVTITVLSAVSAALLLGLRRLLPGPRGTLGADAVAGAPAPSRVRSHPGRDRLILLGGLALAVGLGAGGLWWGTGGLATPPQAFDAVFHLAAVQTIREGGDASSLGGLADLYQGRRVYYPTVWHGAAALLPGTASLASNVLVIIVGAVSWPLGVVGLIDACCVGARTPVAGGARVGVTAAGGPGSGDAVAAPGSAAGRARALTLAAGALAAAATSALAVTLTTLAVWPYALSLVCLPGVLALAHTLTSAAGWRPRLVVGLLAAGAAAGAVAAHGGAVFNLLVLLAALAVSWVARLLRAGGARRRRVLSVLVLALAAGAAGAWVMRAPLASVLGYERDGGSALATLAQSLMDTPQYGPLTWHGLPVGIGLLALAAVAVHRRGREMRLHLVTWVLTLGLVVLTGGPQWPGRALGAVWYLQKARVQPLVVIALLVLAGHGLHLLLTRWCGQDGPRARRRTTALVGAVAATALLAAPLHAQLAGSIHDDERIAYGTLVTEAELAAQGELAALLPPGAVVVAAPSLGGTYLWIEHGVAVVYRTRVQPAADSPELRLADAPAVLEPGSQACAALEELGADYYLSVTRNPSGLEHGSAPLRWDADLAHWPSEGMESVGTVATPTGSLTLNRIIGCG